MGVGGSWIVGVLVMDSFESVQYIFQVKSNKNVKINVKYFGSTARFLSYNGCDKS